MVKIQYGLFHSLFVGWPLAGCILACLLPLAFLHFTSHENSMKMSCKLKPRKTHVSFMLHYYKGRNYWNEGRFGFGGVDGKLNHASLSTSKWHFKVERPLKWGSGEINARETWEVRDSYHWRKDWVISWKGDVTYINASKWLPWQSHSQHILEAQEMPGGKLGDNYLAQLSVFCAILEVKSPKSRSPKAKKRGKI